MCITEGALSAPWLESLHAQFVEPSLEMEMIERTNPLLRRVGKNILSLLYWGIVIVRKKRGAGGIVMCLASFLFKLIKIYE